MDATLFEILVIAIPSVIVPLLSWLAIEAIRYLRSRRLGESAPVDGRLENAVSEALRDAGDRLVEALLEREQEKLEKKPDGHA